MISLLSTFMIPEAAASCLCYNHDGKHYREQNEHPKQVQSGQAWSNLDCLRRLKLGEQWDEKDLKVTDKTASRHRSSTVQWCDQNMYILFSSPRSDRGFLCAVEIIISFSYAWGLQPLETLMPDLLRLTVVLQECTVIYTLLNFLAGTKTMAVERRRKWCKGGEGKNKGMQK